MVVGQKEGRLTKKRQVAFPKKFREDIGDEFIVTKGMSEYLLVIAKKNWKVLLEGTEGKPFTQRATRDLQRYLFGNATEIVLDSQGRMIIPEYLAAFAKLSQEVVFVGVERYVEIWDKELLHHHEEKVSHSIELLTIDLNQSDGHE